jgi:hypothetical protein
MQLQSNQDQKDLILKEDFILDKNTLIKLNIVELRKPTFSGYVISSPEIKQLLQTLVVIP